MASSVASRSPVGRSSRSTPSACSTSKKNTDRRWDCGPVPLPPRLPNLDAVTWKRCGRPSGLSAIASASAIRSVTGSARAASTTSGSRAVTSSRLRVKIETASPARWICTRAPSSLASNTAVAAEAGQRVGDVGCGLGEHRPDRPAHLQRELVEGACAAGQRRRRDGRQLAAEHRGPAHHRGGDTGGAADGVGHHPDQRALPQLSAEEATQERLLDLGRRREQIVPAVRRDGPAIPSRTRRRCRPARHRRRAPSDCGSAAGSGSERSAAHPTPICRCGSSPDSHDTTTATSRASPSAPASRSRSAMRAILASRAEDAPTSADARATSTSSTPPPWHEWLTTRSPELHSTREIREKPAWNAIPAKGHFTAKVSECQPVAPSGTGSARSAVCV